MDGSIRVVSMSHTRRKKPFVKAKGKLYTGVKEARLWNGCVHPKLEMAIPKHP